MCVCASWGSLLRKPPPSRVTEIEDRISGLRLIGGFWITAEELELSPSADQARLLGPAVTKHDPQICHEY